MTGSRRDVTQDAARRECGWSGWGRPPCQDCEPPQRKAVHARSVQKPTRWARREPREQAIPLGCPGRHDPATARDSQTGRSLLCCRTNHSQANPRI